MKDWGPWDWLAYGGLGLAVFFLALNTALLSFPTMRRRTPRVFRHHRWGFVPLAFFLVATVLFSMKELGWIGRTRGENQSILANPAHQQVAVSAASPSLNTSQYFVYRTSLERKRIETALKAFTNITEHSGRALSDRISELQSVFNSTKPDIDRIRYTSGELSSEIDSYRNNLKEVIAESLYQQGLPDVLGSTDELNIPINALVMLSGVAGSLRSMPYQTAKEVIANLYTPTFQSIAVFREWDDALKSRVATATEQLKAHTVP